MARPRVEWEEMATKASTNLVLYDDYCSFCVAQMRLLKRLDWFNTISVLPMSDPRAAALFPGLSKEQLLEAIRCVSGSGQVRSGARCFRHLALRLPMLIPMALIMWVPGVIWVADRVYWRISRNRYLLSRVLGCDGGTCAVRPPGEDSRGNEKIPAVPAKP